MTDITPITPINQSTKGSIAYDASSVLSLVARAEQILADASIIIDSQTMFELAADDLKACKTLQKIVEEERTKITGPMNTALKGVNALFKRPADILDDAEKLYKGAMLAYTTEQARLAEIQRKQAEAEAQKERERLAEVQRQQEADARAATAAAEKAKADAAAAAASGDQQAAQQALQLAETEASKAEQAAANAHATAATAAVTTLPASIPAPVRVTGVSTRTSVEYEITDMHKLIAHVAQHPELTSLLVEDSVKLRAKVKATGMATILPGVRVYEKKSMAARSA